MKKTKSGYSLIDVLLTLFLLILTLVETLQLLAQAATTKLKSDSIVAMASLLSNRLEELRMLPLNTPEEAGQFQEEITATRHQTFVCRWRTILESAQAWRLEIKVNPLGQADKGVEATLWIIPSLGF
ncbi:MAG: hypothetical protein ACUVR0_11360 [Candidatus Aminicenantales bacterium]